MSYNTIIQTNVMDNVKEVIYCFKYSNCKTYDL